MLERPNACAEQRHGSHTNPAATAWTLEDNRRRLGKWLSSGLLLITPLFFWFYFSHTVAGPMAPLYTGIQACIVTIVLLIALISWEALRVEHFILRLTYATFFITGGILMAIELVFQNHQPTQSPYIKHLLTSHLVSTAQILLAVALLLVCVRPKRPIYWHVPRSNAMLWIAGILFAAIALFITNGLQVWGPEIPWERAVPTIFAIVPAGLYCGAIIVMWRDAHRTPNHDTADCMIAILFLSVADAIQITALIGQSNLLLLNQFYQLAGYAWVLRYSFMVGFREPYKRLQQSEN